MSEQPIETTIKELLERGSSYKFTEGQIGMVLHLIQEDKKRLIKEVQDFLGILLEDDKVSAQKYLSSFQKLDCVKKLKELEK